MSFKRRFLMPVLAVGLLLCLPISGFQSYEANASEHHFGGETDWRWYLCTLGCYAKAVLETTDMLEVLKTDLKAANNKLEQCADDYLNPDSDAYNRPKYDECKKEVDAEKAAAVERAYADLYRIVGELKFCMDKCIENFCSGTDDTGTIPALDGDQLPDAVGQDIQDGMDNFHVAESLLYLELDSRSDGLAALE